MYCVAYQVLQFAVDKLLNPDSPNPLWMYGGDKCRNDLAIKVASHELKGMQAMFSCKVANLHFPLMCSIDYKGFCVLAECKLRISEKTLQYGSSDGGYTVVNRNATLSAKMNELARRLFLAPHMCGVREKNVIACPADIEAHLGEDNRYWVIDFARVFPPEYPIEAFERGQTVAPRSVFYNLLRPEFLVPPLRCTSLVGMLITVVF